MAVKSKEIGEIIGIIRKEKEAKLRNEELFSPIEYLGQRNTVTLNPTETAGLEAQNQLMNMLKELIEAQKAQQKKYEEQQRILEENRKKLEEVIEEDRRLREVITEKQTTPSLDSIKTPSLDCAANDVSVVRESKDDFLEGKVYIGYKRLSSAPSEKKSIMKLLIPHYKELSELVNLYRKATQGSELMASVQNKFGIPKTVTRDQLLNIFARMERDMLNPLLNVLVKKQKIEEAREAFAKYYNLKNPKKTNWPSLKRKLRELTGLTPYHVTEHFIRWAYVYLG